MEDEEPVFENQAAEIVYLRAQLANERAARIKLDDELDLLAWDNDRLRNLVNALPKESPPVPVKPPPTSAATMDNTVVDVIEQVPDEFLMEGNGNYANKVVSRINNACGGMNALCVAFCPLPMTNDQVHKEGSWAMACGGVDKIFRVYSIPWLLGSVVASNHSSTIQNENQLMLSCPLSAPILAMAVYGPLVACAMMDGGLAVIDLASSSSSASHNPTISDQTALFVYKDHSKFTVSVAWSPDGRWLATASHDKTVHIYRQVRTEVDTEKEGEKGSRRTFAGMERIHTARFVVTPECVVFVPSTLTTSSSSSSSSSSSDSNNSRNSDSNDSLGVVEWELVVALRDTAHLCYIDCTAPGAVDIMTTTKVQSNLTIDTTQDSAEKHVDHTTSVSVLPSFKTRKVSLNEADWDTHVSFTPLCLSLSPDHKYLLIATDKGFHFVVRVGSSKRLRLLAGGHSCGDYGKPKVCWDPTGHYIYSNSDEGDALCVYALASERPVQIIAGVHQGQAVRDVVCFSVHHSDLDGIPSILATASYDKSIALWRSS